MGPHIHSTHTALMGDLLDRLALGGLTDPPLRWRSSARIAADLARERRGRLPTGRPV